MRSVGIVGIGHTKFGKSEVPFMDMVCDAALQAMDDAGAKTGRNNVIDQVFVGTMGAGMVNRISGTASAVVDTLNIRPAMAETVENGPASGASAIKLGFMAIASGMCDCVLIIGAEGMRAVTGWEGTDFVATMLHPESEYKYGATLPAFAGMFTRLCMDKYGLESKDLSIVSVKNHANACKNPCAHIHSRVVLERITNPAYINATNPIVADPLRQFDMCPVSDGAAAVLLVAEDKKDSLGFGDKKFVKIAGMGSATDTHVVANREVPSDLLAVRLSAKMAYEMAGVGPEDIDVAELHDAFQILEIAESEEVGFFKRGEGHLAARNGETALTGKKPVNTSGGLKAKGHPLGATGVSQVVELVRQLRGEAGERQVEGAKTGLAVNFGGFGNNVVSTVLTTK
ncbi:acetyl-CoA acetyltransferase [Anaerocolumna aminovalerica]|uniref:thiolase C-terminal domain-containing protein n=1 Tax=Anaerocolumna aminovalerica TaxID=1527 RepID=UPI001C0F10AD|nr:acetyl-CoA acetyltransferase [Anaerocolumna aminovalerica]MBU5333248.1 acetyl-CoA acetyltransferase [Anaerocolumna aminovalerica]